MSSRRGDLVADLAQAASKSEGAVDPVDQRS
jgi:hypothetical protein